MAWHQMTDVRPDGFGKDDAFPWNVTIQPLYRPNTDGSFAPHIVNSAEWAIPVADDDGLPVGNGTPFNRNTYGIHTPHQLWDMFVDIVGERNIESAGTINNRGGIYISADIDSIVQAEHREFGTHLNAIDTLTPGSSSIIITQWMECIVCHNTLNACTAWADKLRKGNQGSIDWTGQHRVIHSVNVESAVNEARQKIKGVFALSDKFAEEMLKLHHQKVSEDFARQLYAGFITPPNVETISTRVGNTIDDLVTLFKDGKGNEGENLADVLSGFTELKTSGGFVSADSKVSASKRFASSEFGNSAKQKEKFSSLLISGDFHSAVERGKNLFAETARSVSLAS
jgi:hypothetical protein